MGSFHPCVACGNPQYLFGREGVTCYWCNNPRDDAKIKAGIHRKVERKKTKKEVLSEMEKERLRLHKHHRRKNQ